MSEYVLNNRYRVLAQIAGGGMAVVYKAHDTVLNRVVAVKVLRDTFAQDVDFRARFQREAQAAANLTHPNIVTVYDYGQDGPQSYIVMEYVEGRDLKTVIRGEAPLPLDRATDLMVQACAALGAAHRAGLVHCDVKPQNILVTNDGRVKVTDFGIARAMSASVPQNVETVWGTPHYFSPEQAAGEPPTPASDVYSLGVVLYEMLAGPCAVRCARSYRAGLAAHARSTAALDGVESGRAHSDRADRQQGPGERSGAAVSHRRSARSGVVGLSARDKPGDELSTRCAGPPTGSTTVAATPARSPVAAPAGFFRHRLAGLDVRDAGVCGRSSV